LSTFSRPRSTVHHYIWQRIAGSFGVGLIAALFTAEARSRGPVTGLHVAALVIVGVSAAAVLAAAALPAVRNTALVDR
jgi:hypothetical protein